MTPQLVEVLVFWELLKSNLVDGGRDHDLDLNSFGDCVCHRLTALYGEQIDYAPRSQTIPVADCKDARRVRFWIQDELTRNHWEVVFAEVAKELCVLVPMGEWRFEKGPAELPF